jgi:hypothetical protein
MPSPLPISEVLADLAASLGRNGGASGAGVGGWLVTLASVLALVVAVRAARRLTRRSTPELIVLLNQSAAFYRRWPEDRLAGAPRTELVAEAARCRRIVELLQTRPSTAVNGGAIAGLQAWIMLLGRRIDQCIDLPSGPAYA